MSDNWVVGNLQNALDTWNAKVTELWNLILTSPQNFKGGGIWTAITNVNTAMQALGTGLLVLFFVIGVVKTCGSFTDLKKPEHAVKLFVRFILAKAVITQGMELMTTLFGIVQSGIASIMTAAGVSSATDTVLPDDLVSAIENCGFWESIPLWAVTLIGGLFITIMSFIMIMSVYGRFFKLYMYTAIAPIPLSAVIVLACIIFSLFVSSPPVVAADAPPVTMVWAYIGELVFNMLVLVGTVKMSDRIIREMMGL